MDYTDYLYTEGYEDRANALDKALEQLSDFVVIAAEIKEELNFANEDDMNLQFFMELFHRFNSKVETVEDYWFTADERWDV